MFSTDSGTHNEMTEAPNIDHGEFDIELQKPLA